MSLFKSIVLIEGVIHNSTKVRKDQILSDLFNST
jgi:hypothetical protein